MKRKKRVLRSELEKSFICRDVICRRANGEKLGSIAESYGINSTMLNRWMKEFRADKYRNDSKESEVLKIVSDEMERLEFSEKLTILLSATRGRKIILKISVTEKNDIEKREAEICRLILDQLRWSIVDDKKFK